MLKRISTVICASFIVCAHAHVGHASVFLVATPIKTPPVTPFLAPDSALPAPWVSYQLSIQTTGPNELIGAVDVSFTGDKLHQRWVDVDFDGIVDPTPQGAASNGRGDSVITAPAGAPFGLPATETNTKTGSPLAGAPGAFEYGLGNLSGAWGLTNAASSANIAYIVIDSHNVGFNGPNIPFTIKSANPAGVRYNDIISIPEPTALALYGMALVGSVGSIRRRSAAAPK
jgi:hypothetical protein